MYNESLQIMAKKMERAKRMERMGNEDEALRIYLDIHDNHMPNTSDLFERPAIILERKRRYQEALDICQKALDLLADDLMTGTASTFEKRINSIHKKMERENIKPASEKKKSRFSFTLGFNLHTMGSLALIAAIVATVFWLAVPRESPLEDLEIDMTQMERESELEGSIFDEPTDPEILLPPEVIQAAVNTILEEADVLKAGAAPDADTIGMAVFVSDGTSAERCKELGTMFARALSEEAAKYHDDLNGPTALTLGELYTHYDLIISVGVDTDNIYAKGTKLKGAKLIRWRDQ